MRRIHGEPRDAVNQIILNIHKSGLIIHIDPVASVAIRIHDACIGDVVNFVICESCCRACAKAISLPASIRIDPPSFMIPCIRL